MQVFTDNRFVLRNMIQPLLCTRTCALCFSFSPFPPGRSTYVFLKAYFDFRNVVINFNDLQTSESVGQCIQLKSEVETNVWLECIVWLECNRLLHICNCTINGSRLCSFPSDLEHDGLGNFRMSRFFQFHTLPRFLGFWRSVRRAFGAALVRLDDDGVYFSTPRSYYTIIF